MRHSKSHRRNYKNVSLAEARVGVGKWGDEALEVSRGQAASILEGPPRGSYNAIRKAVGSYGKDESKEVA